MSRHLIPTFASRGLWLLGLVLAYVLSLAAQQPAGANTQSSPDSSQPRQQGTPSSTKDYAWSHIIFGNFFAAVSYLSM
jgi:hypothetical protein